MVSVAVLYAGLEGTLTSATFFFSFCTTSFIPGYFFFSSVTSFGLKKKTTATTTETIMAVRNMADEIQYG